MQTANANRDQMIVVLLPSGGEEWAMFSRDGASELATVVTTSGIRCNDFSPSDSSRLAFAPGEADFAFGSGPAAP